MPIRYANISSNFCKTTYRYGNESMEMISNSRRNIYYKCKNLNKKLKYAINAINFFVKNDLISLIIIKG